MALVDLDWHPRSQVLRRFGLIGATLSAGGGVLLWDGAPQAIAVLVGAVTLLFAWRWPARLIPVYRALSVVTFPIGFVLSHLVLATLFFAVVVPVGLLAHLLRRDPLRRAIRPEVSSYWSQPPKRDRASYFRQF